MRRMNWVLTGCLLLGTAFGAVPASQEAKDPCLAQRASFDKAAAAVTAAGATYRAVADQRRRAYDLWLKADDAAGKRRETWQAASEAAIKMRDAYNACRENPASKGCAAQKKAADEAGLKAAREYRDAVSADLEAFCAQTALDKAEAEARGAGEAHQAALKALRDAQAVLAQCLRPNKK